MKWKDIKVGQKMKDGSVVTQVHRVHKEECCKLIYDNDREMECSFKHVFLIDVHNLPKAGKMELNQTCTFVPLEESYTVECDVELTIMEKLIIQQFLENQKIDVQVDEIKTLEDGSEIYDFHFDEVKRVKAVRIIEKAEPQKVDDNTYWLTCRGIKYLMDTYKVDLYCNGLIINSIEPIGMKDCFCISTDTGRYET